MATRDKTKMSDEFTYKLKAYGIPEEDRWYFVTPPEKWNMSITSSSGLSRGVEVIFTNIRPIWPNWTQKTEYSQINSKVRKMLSAEKKGKKV